MKRLKLIVIAVVAVLTVIVVFQNTQSVETEILFVTFRMPRALLLFGTLLMGFVLGAVRVDKLVAKLAKRNGRKS